jgi:hypothetical protein
MVTMAGVDFKYGEEVLIPWGIDEVRGTVHEVYGLPHRRYVVVVLTPELSGSIVDEPTTGSLPADTVKKVAPAT